MGFLQLLADYQKFSRSLKGGKLKQARRAWGKLYDDSASLWLAFRYGVTPTLIELEGLMKALRNAERPERKTFRGFANLVTSDEFDMGTEINCFPWFACKLHDKYSHNQQVRASFLAEFRPLQPQNGVSLPEQLGFSWRAVPISIWEALPLSFMADWVVGIGDYLTALNPNPNWVVLGGVCSSKQLSSAERRLISVVQQHPSWFTTASGSESSSYDRRARRLASINEIAPTIHVKMNLKRDIDLIALATTALKSKLRTLKL